MDFEKIEQLGDDEILNLYNNTIENEGNILGATTYVRAYCVCSTGYSCYGWGYFYRDYCQKGIKVARPNAYFYSACNDPLYGTNCCNSSNYVEYVYFDNCLN